MSIPRAQNGLFALPAGISSSIPKLTSPLSPNSISIPSPSLPDPSSSLSRDMAPVRSHADVCSLIVRAHWASLSVYTLAKSTSSSVYDGWSESNHLFWFISCSRIRWKGVMEELRSFGFRRLWRIWDVDERSNGRIWRLVVGGIRKEKFLVVVWKWSLERMIGWAFWRFWRVVWVVEISGGVERRRAMTVVPVPVGTALHQLYSVPPTVRVFVPATSGLGLSSDMLASKKLKEQESEKQPRDRQNRIEGKETEVYSPRSCKKKTLCFHVLFDISVLYSARKCCLDG